MKKIIIYSLIILVCGVLIIKFYLQIAGKDISGYDASDLVVVRSDIPSDKNAFTYFVAATNYFYWPTNSSFVNEYFRGNSVEVSQIIEIVGRNEKAFGLIRQGVENEMCLAPEVIDVNTTQPFVADWLKMGRVLALKARYERLTGKYTESTDTILLLLKFARFVYKDTESFIQYLVGIANLSLGVAQAQDLARHQDAPSVDLRRLLAELTDQSLISSGFIRAMKIEYKILSKTVDQIQSGELNINDLTSLSATNDTKRKLTKDYSGFFFQPNKTKGLFADFYRKMIYNSTLCFSEMQHEYASQMVDFKSEGLLIAIKPNSAGKLLYAIMAPAVEKTLKRKCVIEAEITAARLLVALHLFKNDVGKFPSGLSELIPGYLESIPLDPFNCRPMAYQSSDKIIYSVGEDLKDSGGSRRSSGSKTNNVLNEDRWSTEDAVYQIEIGLE